MGGISLCTDGRDRTGICRNGTQKPGKRIPCGHNAGKLVPAGTGMQCYSDVEVIDTHASDDDPYVTALRGLLDTGENGSDGENEAERAPDAESDLTNV